jgi:hypothetical protein
MLMAKTPSATHRFRVHPRDGDRSHARVLEESSFEAAAVAYLEDFVSIGAETQEIRVVVMDLDDGHEHCFMVDLETGETAPCG